MSNGLCYVNPGGLNDSSIFDVLSVLVENLGNTNWIVLQ